jgi:hypothetical protein
MTSQTYHADDYQLMQERDQVVVPDSDRMEPDAELAVAEPDLAERDLAEPDADLAVAEPELAEPDAELAVAEPELAEPDAELAVAEPDAELAVAEPDLAERDLAEPDAELAEPESDQTGHGDPMSHPVASGAAFADPESAGATESDHPGFAPDGEDGAAEPVMADSSPGSPLVSVAFTVPESVPESHLAGNTARAPGPWNEVQAMFVDDPRASIVRAAALVDDRVEAHIRSVRERQRSMRSPWQASDAGTEALRVALQHYRAFWNGLEDLPE